MHGSPLWPSGSMLVTCHVSHLEHAAVINQFTDVHDLSPGDFEHFVAHVLKESGWKDVYVTQVGVDARHGDGGVDIVGYKNDRKFAVEVKHRTLPRKVETSALNQLVTRSKAINAGSMILVTNSFFTDELVARALSLGVELIDGDRLKTMWSYKTTEIARSIKPRKYQQAVIDQATHALESGSHRLLIELATGLGKTYTAGLLLKELERRAKKRISILFLAHRIEILVQSATAFKNIFTLGNYTASVIYGGAAIADTDIVFATFDTALTRSDSIAERHFDVVVVDEAHHTPAVTYRSVVDALNMDILIGLTATPERQDKKNVLEIFGGSGGHIGKFDLAWALRHRHLAKPHYWVLLHNLDRDVLNKLDERVNLSELDRTLFLEKKDEEMVRKIEEHLRSSRIDSPRVAVFCRSITHIENFLQYFPNGSAVAIHSQLTRDEVRDRIRDFRDGRYSFALTVDLFNEGVDIPEINMVVFARSTRSHHVWLQQLGRGLRLAPDKDSVEVLDFVGSLERISEVRNLQKAANEIRYDPENAAGDKKSSFDKDWDRNSGGVITRDDTIDVFFDEKAADILALVDKFDYRLQDRAKILDAFYDACGSSGELPSLHDFLRANPEITGDQVSTVFGSYCALVKAAMPDADLATIQTEVARIDQRLTDQYGVAPSAVGVSNESHVDGLPLVSRAEAERLRPSLQPVGMTDLWAGEAGNQSEDHVDVWAGLAAKYLHTITNRSDLRILSSEEREAIIDEYGSISAFLVELAKLRDESI